MIFMFRTGRSSASSYVVTYDLSDDRERNRVSRVLEGFGYRVQESVFECCLNGRLKNKLKNRLDALHLETGFVCIYKLSSQSRRITVGTPPAALPEDTYAIVV